MDSVFSPALPVPVRVAAYRRIESLAQNDRAPRSQRNDAAHAIIAIAENTQVPTEVRDAAIEAIRELKLMSPSEAVEDIRGQTVGRTVDEIMLHHTERPQASEFQGKASVEDLVRFHVEGRGWSRAGFHYIITPAGEVWRGRPLEALAVNVWVPGQPSRNLTGVNVTLVLNGDTEEVSPAQRRAAGIVLRALHERFSLDPGNNFRAGRGFHSDYAPERSCPGRLIHKADVLEWIAAAES
jgi:hypothetical protein